MKKLKLAEYANSHLLKDNEYYLYTKAIIYEKFHHYDLALYNYRLAYKIQKNLIAEELITHALDIQSSNILCNIAMGLLKFELEDYFSARDYFSYALMIKPNYPCAYFCFAICEIKLGSDYGKIVGFLEKIAQEQTCSYIIQLISFINNNESDLYDRIEVLLKEQIEYEYVKVPEQISKSLVINPSVNIHEAYQYIINNFYLVSH